MSAALIQQLRRLADARATLIGYQDELSRLRAEFNQQHAQLVEDAASASAAVGLVEADVRALTVSTYQMTGEKKPAPGVEIVMSSKMDYDEAAALAWARERKMALVPESLDKKAFEKIAKATPIEFVTYRQEPSVRIATQLNAALLVESVATTTEEGPF